MKYVHYSPVRCSSPVRSPVRAACCDDCHDSPTVCVQRPILHLREEDELVNGLRDFISLERELEASKTALTLKPDFNLHDAFTIFDGSRSGLLSHSDIREGLNAIGVFPTSEEVDLFFKRYDDDHNLRINFHEFSLAFLS